MKQEMLDIIVRVLSGDTSPEDREKLSTWLGQDQENLKAFSQAESIWNALEIMRAGKEFNSEDAFIRFKEMVGAGKIETSRTRIKRTIDIILRIAAIIVIVSGLSYWIINSGGYNSSVSDAVMSEVIAPRGSKAQVLLPDGTKVWLNADSKIIYQKSFNIKEREIRLEGEGYFEVARNPDKPFIVSTSDIRIRALGTSFNVKSYAGEPTIEATLIEGKVELEMRTSGGETKKLVTLKPNQRATYYKNSALSDLQQDSIKESAELQDITSKFVEKQIVLKEIINTDQTISWKNNRIYFDNETFQDLAIKLERRFDVKIHIMDEDLKKMRFSGRFDDVIIEQVLEALQFASPFYYSLNDKDIYISDKPLKDNHLKSDPD